MIELVRTAVYPGSFDPLTLGHLDVVTRGAKMFDHVIVAVLVNLKKTPLFTSEERTALIRESVKGLPNVSVDSFSGLLVNYLQEKQATVIIRGLRFISDLETELQMASMNRELMPESETIFIPTNHEFSYLSSSLIKEIARHRGDVSRFVPGNVLHALREKQEERFG